MNNLTRASMALLVLLLATGFSQGAPVVSGGATASTPAPVRKELPPEIKLYLANAQSTITAHWQAKAVALGFGGNLSVNIRYTIFADGSVKAAWVDKSTPSTAEFAKLGIESIQESAPFPPFSKKMAKWTGGKVTGNFAFSLADK